MKTILGIGDQSTVRSLIKRMLTESGFNALCAEDGLSGIQLAKQQQPDLIICDIHMPNYSGYDVLSELRRTPATATTPFIFVTGANDKTHQRQAMELGADDYLNKPFTMEGLVKAIHSRLQKHAVVTRHFEKKLSALRDTIGQTLPHELRTPLNGILGFSTLLMEEHHSMSPAEVEESSARHIHQSATRLHQLIEKLLTLTQLEQQSSDEERSGALQQCPAYPIRTLVLNKAHQVANLSQRQTDFSGEVEEASAFITQDNLERLVEELVENAFKFSQPGTPVRIYGRQEESRYTMVISNLGRGFTPEQISLIGAHVQFERNMFEQQGCGLGLAIVKRLLLLHNGELRVESSPGQSTTIRVTLPAQGRGN